MRLVSRPTRQDDDVTRLRLMLLSDARAAQITPGRPKLLMLAGLPGSGKSTFADRVNAQHPFLTVETDRLRKVLVPQPEYSPAEHYRVFRACHRLIDEFLAEGYPVLFDATNISERNRKPVYAIADRRKVPLAVVVLSAPPEVIRRRLMERKAGRDPDSWSDAGWGICLRMAPSWQNVRRPHIQVDTSTEINEALSQVLEWAKE